MDGGYFPFYLFFHPGRNRRKKKKISNTFTNHLGIFINTLVHKLEGKIRKKIKNWLKKCRFIRVRIYIIIEIGRKMKKKMMRIVGGGGGEIIKIKK